MIPILLAAALAAPTTLAEMRWHKRVLLVAAPAADDAGIAGQRRALAGWDKGARERDLAIVTVIGDRVTGATDSAAALRTRHRLPRDRFVAILIGKDGGEKMRAGSPIPAETLAETIDAMPMRRARLD
ncbi:DUF4174 domain-containing protein [Sphingomonas sp. CLY1604]|uniref:DUF4174 domain-containing protein n=1 Tax=Sphingomonas sp. CLY1604 TaxID=3457786 RepID=UPI003FD75218